MICSMKYILGLSLLVSVGTTLASSYDDVFGEYYEYCTGTRLKYQPAYYGGATGGIGGHGFMYIHGLCKDYSKNFPQVKVCDENDDHKGVGVSLDSDYLNVQWVAVPGRELMIFGDKNPNEIVTHEMIQEITQKSYQLKIFENVKLKGISEKLAFNSEDYQKETARFSIGTDLAINWARDLRCVRIPVIKEKLGDTAEYLNSLNQKYYYGPKEYKWSDLKNNCVHLATNVANKLGITKSAPTDKSKLTQIMNLAVPSNYYLHLVDKAVLKKRVKDRYTPNQFGSLMAKYPAFPTNDMFITEDLNALTLPRKNLLRLRATPVSYDRFLKEAKYTSLEENALYWDEIYSKKDDGKGFKPGFIAKKVKELRDFLTGRSL